MEDCDVLLRFGWKIVRSPIDALFPMDWLMENRVYKWAQKSH